MIVVDIETSGGFDPVNIGVWQIGSIVIEHPSETFLDEVRIDDSDLVEEGALKVIGKSEEYLRNPKKQSQKELLEKFFAWVGKFSERDILCHNPQFDYGFLRVKATKYGLQFPFRHHCFDLHSIAAVKYFELKGVFLQKDCVSAMKSSFIFEFCGLSDERIQLDGARVIKQGLPHNGLTDSKLEAESYYRLVYGKKLLPEFERFEIPNYLKK